jgi:hypothetical protein
MWCSYSRLIDERILNTASVTSKPLRGAFLARVGSRAGRGACFSDATSTSHRAGRLMGITHVGWYHMVLIQPPNRPLDAAYALRNVKSVTQAAVCGGLVARVFVILRPHHIERAGSWASHTSGGIMWCSYRGFIDHWVPHTLYVTSNPLLKPPSEGVSRRPINRLSGRLAAAGPDVKHHTCQVIPCGAQAYGISTV